MSLYVEDMPRCCPKAYNVFDIIIAMTKTAGHMGLVSRLGCLLSRSRGWSKACRVHSNDAILEANLSGREREERMKMPDTVTFRSELKSRVEPFH